MPERERFGDFLLHERLAVGGMGELYLATRAERRSPPFALKILARSYRNHPEFVAMFQDEARIGMRLAHSNIVGVHEVGTAEATAFIVMEYVHGENLRAVLRAMHRLEERMAPSLAVKIAIDVLRGLDHAHRAVDESGKPLKLVHRDLSPDNILVSYQGEVKILDFGIAKAQGRTTQTQVGVVKGKPLYMSPEQAAAWPVDARSDLFSLAVVLLELLTGEKRFPEDEARWERARSWKPASILGKVPGLPPELDAVLLRALEPDLAKRHQTADELASDLTRIARGGALPRAKESLPSFLKRLFPQGAERAFDSSQVTVLRPRWARSEDEEEPDDTRPAVNLATLTAEVDPHAPTAFGLPDGRRPPARALAQAPDRSSETAALAAPTAVAAPVRKPDRPSDTAEIAPVTSLATTAATTAAGLAPVLAGPTTLAVPPRPIDPVSRTMEGIGDPTAPQFTLPEDERATHSSEAPRARRMERRTALQVLAVLAPITLLASGLAVWRLWRAPDPEPAPTPSPTPAKTPSVRRPPAKRPSKPKSRSTPRKTPAPRSK